MSVPAAKRGGIYKRLETDAEYRDRLRAAGKLAPEVFAGTWLDAFGDEHKLQRRIVESSAD